jgi:NADH-quinone oxidoreductase subunit M
MLKMGLYSIMVATAYRSTCSKRVHVLQFRLQELYMVPFLLYAKRLKECLLFISPRWVNCSGTYTLTIDGLRGAVLQMIAHGFVVVGLFSSLTSFLDDMKHELSLKWVVYVHNHHDLLRCSYFVASVALPTTFNFVEVYGLIQPFAN